MKTSDEEIKKVLLDEYNRNKNIDCSKVKIEVDDGSIKLLGILNSYKAKILARELASLIVRVEEVVDEMSFEKVETVLDESRLKKRVENKLLWDSSLNSQDIQVQVDKGKVVLSGDVDAYWQKEKAERIVEDIRGVEQVENSLFIVHSDKVTDEMIGSGIMASLKRNINVNPNEVNVNIDNSKVTLTGEVGSFLQRESVYNAALYTNGVKEIVDKLKVKLT